MAKRKRGQPQDKGRSVLAASTNKPVKQSTAKKPQEFQSRPTIPFDAEDRILLVGEGDLSFARSLVDHHGCANLTATCYDSKEQVAEKYPQAVDNAESITAEGQTVIYGVDATKMSQKEVRKGEKWDKIFFNFPHVGGKSTDVNRQVRYNQEMLVGFFKASAPLLSHQGTMIVTLFEGEPYTLWNIRDLARHSGLEVQKSFKFQPDAYPGYAHARTLGNIEGGGGWRGENRLARTYVFQVKLDRTPTAQRPEKKRRRGTDSDTET